MSRPDASTILHLFHVIRYTKTAFIYCDSSDLRHIFNFVFCGFARLPNTCIATGNMGALMEGTAGQGIHLFG